MSSPAPKIRQRSVSYSGVRTYRYGPSTTRRCGTPFSSAPAPEGNKAPANSSLAHPIFATAHVPATTEPTRSTMTRSVPAAGYSLTRKRNGSTRRGSSSYSPRQEGARHEDGEAQDAGEDQRRGSHDRLGAEREAAAGVRTPGTEEDGAWRRPKRCARRRCSTYAIYVAITRPASALFLNML